MRSPSAAFAVAVCVGTALLFSGCQSGEVPAVDVTHSDLLGDWKLADAEETAGLMMDPDGGFHSATWSSGLFCSVGQSGPGLSGSWSGGGGSSNSVYFYVDEPCEASWIGLAEHVGDDLEIWFYEPGIDLDGYPEPLWKLRRD